MIALRHFAAAAAFAALIPASASAADLSVSVQGLRNNDGRVMVCVFSPADSGFPDCPTGGLTRSAKATIKGGTATAVFKGLKDGTYAVLIVHDQNGNGTMDTNLLGMPSEGVGVSTNARVVGRPSFEQVQFQLKGKAALTIKVKYLM